MTSAESSNHSYGTVPIFESRKIDDFEREAMYKRVDEIGEEFKALIGSFGSSREWSLAVTKIEEAAMWMRKAVDRM